MWMYQDCDFDGFQDYITNYSWDRCFTSMHVNQVCVEWSNMFLDIARMFIPKKLYKSDPGTSLGLLANYKDYEGNSIEILRH